jgi:DNA helicase HerA-like ATPase
LDAIWRTVSDPRDRRRRFVIVDEAWLLLRDGEDAKFLYRLAKSARKHWAGLTVVTQDAADVLASDLGRAVVSNSATQILLRQAPQAIDQVCEAFRLSDGERAFLLAADRGEALLSCGSQRVALRSLASPVEHTICTTDPAELADLDADGATL